MQLQLTVSGPEKLLQAGSLARGPRCRLFRWRIPADSYVPTGMKMWCDGKTRGRSLQLCDDSGLETTVSTGTLDGSLRYLRERCVGDAIAEMFVWASCSKQPTMCQAKQCCHWPTLDSILLGNAADTQPDSPFGFTWAIRHYIGSLSGRRLPFQGYYQIHTSTSVNGKTQKYNEATILPGSNSGKSIKVSTIIAAAAWPWLLQLIVETGMRLMNWNIC